MYYVNTGRMLLSFDHKVKYRTESALDLERSRHLKPISEENYHEYGRSINVGDFSFKEK